MGETPPSFDVFMCHNTKDKKRVIEIARKLRQRGLKPWLDIWELRPGFPWQRLLERQIGSVQSAAVFVGAGDVGPWQEFEIEEFMRQLQQRDRPTILVLLPGASDAPLIPTFLEGSDRVDFRQDGSGAFDRLISGITGQPPQP